MIVQLGQITMPILLETFAIIFQLLVLGRIYLEGDPKEIEGIGKNVLTQK